MSVLEDPQATFPSATLRLIEEELSEPLFLGVPLGATLNDCLMIWLSWGNGDWRRRTRWMNAERKLRHRLSPRRSRAGAVSLPHGTILMTWCKSTPRFDEMLLPVLTELEHEPCGVLFGDSNVASRLPPGTPSLGWDQLMTYEAGAWRAEYERCRPELNSRVKGLCRRLGLPRGSFELLSFNLMIASQEVAGSLEFLERSRPSVVLTEYDRNKMWSCLVLAARRLHIPSVTLVHGVMGQDALGFAPVVADWILCWGELDRAKLVAAGVPAKRILIGGCPRLSRDLHPYSAQGRSQLRLDPKKSVVMLATSPGRAHHYLSELFCAAVESLPSVSGVVRIHPAEKLSTYAELARQYPGVQFLENSRMELDESLATADVVVVSQSGVGSDALVKRRPVVILDSEADLTGSSRDLVELAGCSHARTAEELADILALMLGDAPFRERKDRQAERYVADFCGAFGRESAQRIADFVREVANDTCRLSR